MSGVRAQWQVHRDRLAACEQLLNHLNEALYKAFYVDEAAARRFASLKAAVTDDVWRPLTFGLISLEPAPAEVIAFLERLEGVTEPEDSPA